MALDDRIEEARILKDVSAATPSSFLEHMSHLRGKRLAKTLDTRLPVYEQERFERKLYHAHGSIVGAGSSVSMSFIPSDDMPNLRLVQLYAIQGTSGTEAYRLTHRWFEASASRSMVVSRIVAGADQPFTMVNASADQFLDGGLQKQMVSPPIDLYKKQRGEGQRSDLTFTSESTIPVADSLDLFWIFEEIPDLAQFGFLTNVLT